MQRQPASRFLYLDGLRGVAITLVMLFHAYARWPRVVPYSNQFAGFPLFANGWLGVELFFLISGFVIYMTLEQCETLGEFFWRRWTRLFPAMLVCSLIIFLTLPLFPQRPAGTRSYIDILPGITFIDPAWWNWAGVQVLALDGAFWSIFVEVKFYIAFGLLYFIAGGAAAVASMFGLSLLHVADILAGGIPYVHQLADNANTLFGSYFAGWFAAGALYYRYWQQKEVRLLVLAIGIASSIVVTIPPQSRLAAGMIVTLFTAAVVFESAQRLFANRAVVFVGFISYPLYLLHQNIMIALTVDIAYVLPRVPLGLTPIPAVVPIAGVAWLGAVVMEPKAIMALRRSSVDAGAMARCPIASFRGAA